MDKEDLDYKEGVFSPIDSYYWIEQGVFDYLLNEQVFKPDELNKFKTRYKEHFNTALSKVGHLINNELDKGNVYVVLVVVSVFEAFIEQDIQKSEAILLTDSCINKPIRAYMIDGARKLFDDADDPFQMLVQTSKEKEENYFGSSFDFERPIDNDYGYVLKIKKCLFHETLKVLKREELQLVLCRIDLGWINGIDSEKHLMQFVRPVTFATGNTCQMWFMRKERKTIMD